MGASREELLVRANALFVQAGKEWVNDKLRVMGMLGISVESVEYEQVLIGLEQAWQQEIQDRIDSLK